MAADLNSLTVFLAVADTRNFRIAAERLGVTRSAVSQSLRKLEDTLGIALVHRTTRSVRLTEAGEALHGRVSPALADVEAALAGAMDRDKAPSGQLRLAVSSIAERFLAGPLFASFADAHPGVQLDVTVTDDEFDIVAAGYDAGVRLGELVEQDMIAVPASGDQRQLVVASPAHLVRHGTPAHPRELVTHRCIGWRPSPKVAPYRWDFEENGRRFDVVVNPQVTTNEMRVMVNTALAGGGFTLGLEETFRQYIARGELVAVLEAFCPPFPGFFLYYPDRRNHAPKLRAFVDHVRKQSAMSPAP
jgi:DNA-binding transcriptional LysR family regulator